MTIKHIKLIKVIMCLRNDNYENLHKYNFYKLLIDVFTIGFVFQSKITILILKKTILIINIF